MLSVLNKILKISGKRKNKIIRGIIASVFEAISIKVPIMIMLISFVKIVEGSLEISDIYYLTIALAVTLFIGIIMNYIENANQMGTGYEIYADERLKLGDRLKRFSMGYFTEGNLGNLSAVVTSDIKFIEEVGMMQLGKIVAAMLAIVVMIIFMFFISIRIAIMAVIITLISSLLFGKLQKIAKHNSKESQEKQKDVVEAVIEYVKGMPVIKAFNITGAKQKKTNEKFEKLKEAQIAYERKFGLPLIIINSVVGIATGLIIYLAADAVINEDMLLAYGITLVVFSFEMFKPITVLSGLSAEIRVMEAALNRYEDTFKIKEIDDVDNYIELKSHDVEFRNVTFSYESDEIIKNMSFLAKEKAMTALVGKSGCGKTTVTNLIARFWEVDSGEIYIGGINIRSMSFDCLMENISMVFQDVYLFNDTIYNNIAFGKKGASKKEVIEAAKKARCYDFIMKYENGFDTMIGEGGMSLSGGEKQRISIARAILKDAPIILLDEATASVDPDNEKSIQDAINELISQKTLIVIAHKLSTIKNASNILVIEEGQIVNSGKHDELIKKPGLYQNLWLKRSRSRAWQIEREAK